MQVTKEQALEWLENPVTVAFAEAVKEQRDHLDSSKKATWLYAPFEPQKTQERMANLNGAIDTWEEVLEVVTGQEILGMLTREDEDDEE